MKIKISNRQWKWIWLAFAGFTFCLSLWRILVSPHESDAVAYFTAGKAALTGSTPYIDQPTPFKYLPVVAYFFIPFSVLPFAAAEVSIFILSFAITVALYLWLIRRVGNALAFLIFATFARFHFYDFINVQINHWILGLILGFLFLRKKHPWASAICLALGASFKVTPLLLLLPLVLDKNWKEALRASGVFAVCLLLPLLTFGGWRVYSDWLHLLETTTPWKVHEAPIIQNVQAMLYYWLNPMISFEALTWMVRVLFVGMVLATLRFAKTQLASFSALLVLSVIFSPLAWKHHYLLLLPGYLLIVENTKQLKIPLIIGFFMAWFPSTVISYSRHIADRSYSTVFGALVEWWALIWNPGKAKKRG